MSELVKLGDYVDVLTGYPFKSSGYIENPNGVRLLRGDNIGQGRIRWDNAKLWPADEFNVHKQYQLQAGDVVLAMDRPWIEAGLKCAEIRADDVPSLLVQRVARLRALPGLDQRYLAYLIRSPRFTDYVLGVQTGTAVPHISAAQIRDFEFCLPPLRTQQAIAAVLGALDDKIAVNERIARSCDELRALRFVDFIQSSPSKVIERPLSSFADFVNGRAFTKNATGTGRMVIRIAEINSGPGGSTVYNDIDVPDRHLARPGDVLFAWSGSLTVARWFRPEAIVNQHIFKVIPRDGLPNWLLFELIRTKLKKFQSIAADKATTMGHIQRRHLDEPVSAPADDVVSRLDSQLGPLWERALTAEQESLTLAALRDTLLPKLISGELRVRDAEKAVEEAL